MVPRAYERKLAGYAPEQGIYGLLQCTFKPFTCVIVSH